MDAGTSPQLGGGHKGLLRDIYMVKIHFYGMIKTGRYMPLCPLAITTTIRKILSFKYLGILIPFT